MKRLLWPLIMLAALLIINVIDKPDFFSITVQDGKLFGNIIDILNHAAPLVLISIGMTIVIATKGVDLSVGSIVSIAGAGACMFISTHNAAEAGTLVIAVLFAVLLSTIAGLWNGVLVSIFGVQPIVATLILMVAGRGVAQLITGGQIITVNSPAYTYIGSGFLLGLPFSIFIAAFFFLIAALVTRKTAIGLFIESVGSNLVASRLMGLRAKSLILCLYIVCGFLSGIAGLILSSYVSSADGNNAGLWYELDAILAVVIGGTSLNGGRFYLSGTLIGALIIQTLTTTIYSIGVKPEATLVVKAIVVTAVCLLQSEAFRKKVVWMLSKMKRTPIGKQEVREVNQ